ncbi:MAG: HIT family hydrolase [Elusimicrobia bacterium HGW-Elusimicrobia-2]|nr:MAG: HIT family hydrolase [Elusimicrobia bacterium HGW-Elusimicrobia-2]
MKYLAAPWRDKYFDMKQDGCIFCKAVKAKKDSENFVVMRGEKCFLMLNLFPYTNAHVMAAPYRHTGDVTKLSAEETSEMAAMVVKAVTAMKKLFHCEGFNIGVNQGAAAGAGFASHIHTHIVGRWKGDTNFMTTLAATRVTPSSPEKIYKMLKRELA